MAAPTVDNTNNLGATGLKNVETKIFYQKTLMKSLRDQLHAYKLCKKTPLPKNNGDTISWRLLKDLDSTVATSELSELTPPAPDELTIINFEAKVKQYGRYVQLSQMIDDYAIDPIATDTVDLLGRQAGQVFEKIIMKTATSSSNVMYADKADGATTAAGKTITSQDIIQIKAFFKKFSVKPLEGGKYVALISPEVAVDLLTTANALGGTFAWQDVSKYAHPEDAFDGELGEWLGIRWIESNYIEKNATAPTAYECLFLGEDGLGVVNLEGESNEPEIIYHGPGSAGTNDALNQIQTIGWKNKGFCARILRDEAVLRYVVGTKATIPAAIEDENRFGKKEIGTGFNS